VFTIPDLMATALGELGIAIEGKPQSYSLRRCKAPGTWATEVWIHFGSLGVNLSHRLDYYPRTFAEARGWIVTVSRQYDWQLTENQTWFK
jgi:hypothetical protein